MNNFEPSFTRYLAAKKSVDDRALNRVVWERLAANLPAGDRPLRLLDMGAGIGTMAERMLDWGLLQVADLTCLDEQAEPLRVAHRRLVDWAGQHGVQVNERSDKLELVSDRGCVSVQFQAQELFAFLEGNPAGRSWDVLAANAFLDLFDIPRVLPRLAELLRPGGWFNATINFDGGSIFEPVLDPRLDEQILALYHRSMDERVTDGRPSGDSRSGRHLLQLCQTAGLPVVEAGSSDWVVFAREGRYPHDEAYFLHYILYMLEGSLRGQVELDAKALTAWVQQRHEQVERGELVYIAHQLDILAQKRDGDLTIPKLLD
jgi:SAM-dependent methyltransferase